VAYSWLSERRMLTKYKHLSKDVTNVTVSGLEKYTEYNFKVQAFTVKPSNWSKMVPKRTKQDGTCFCISIVFTLYCVVL